MSESDTEATAAPPEEEPKPKAKKSNAKKSGTRTKPQRKPASEATIPTGSSADEVKVSERERPLESTAWDVEPSPTQAEEMERIREEEDAARERQEAEAQADNELRQAIDQEKDARDQEQKLAFGQPEGTQVDERGEVELGNCLACGEPVTAAEGYMKFPGGITHMHECARAYHHGLREKVGAARGISHEPNEVRHPDLAQPNPTEPSGGQQGAPLNVAQGTTAMAGQGALGEDALPVDEAAGDVRIETIEPDEFDQPIREAVKEQQERTAEIAKEQQESGEYVKNP